MSMINGGQMRGVDGGGRVRILPGGRERKIPCWLCGGKGSEQVAGGLDSPNEGDDPIRLGQRQVWDQE